MRKKGKKNLQQQKYYSNDIVCSNMVYYLNWKKCLVDCQRDVMIKSKPLCARKMESVESCGKSNHI